VFPYLPQKAAPTFRERIQRAIAGGPVCGQAALGQAMGLSSLEDWNTLASTLRSMLAYPAELRERRVQLPGTGHEGPPVYEYWYEKL